MNYHLLATGPEGERIYFLVDSGVAQHFRPGDHLRNLHTYQAVRVVVKKKEDPKWL